MTQARFDKALVVQIGNLLREVRENLELSQDDVKESTKLDVGRYERGESNISITTLGILCRHYQITLEDFFKRISL